MSVVLPPVDMLDTPAPTLVRHRLNADPYHRMAELGVLASDARTELIAGKIIEMAAMGARHHAALTRLTRLLVHAVGDQAAVTVQQPGAPEPIRRARTRGRPAQAPRRRR